MEQQSDYRRQDCVILFFSGFPFFQVSVAFGVLAAFAK